MSDPLKEFADIYKICKATDSLPSDPNAEPFGDAIRRGFVALYEALDYQTPLYIGAKESLSEAFDVLAGNKSGVLRNIPEEIVRYTLRRLLKVVAGLRALCESHRFLYTIRVGENHDSSPNYWRGRREEAGWLRDKLAELAEIEIPKPPFLIVADEAYLWATLEQGDISEGALTHLLGLYRLTIRERHLDFLAANNATSASEVLADRAKAYIEKLKGEKANEQTA